MESIIVLNLVICFVLLPTLFFNRITKTFTQRAFFYQFERGVVQVQSVCVMKKQTGKLIIKEKEIEFLTGQHSEKLQLPDEISTFQVSNEEIEISSKGVISSMPKIQFQDNQNKKIITYQFQLGTGRFRKEESHFD